MAWLGVTERRVVLICCVYAKANAKVCVCCFACNGLENLENVCYIKVCIALLYIGKHGRRVGVITYFQQRLGKTLYDFINHGEIIGPSLEYTVSWVRCQNHHYRRESRAQP